MKNIREVRVARQSLREVEQYLLASPLGEMAYRFFLYCPSFVLTDDRCWEWKGTFSGSGYGHMNQGRYPAKARCNRVSFALFREPVPLNPGQSPNTLLVCHSCDNKKCIRPSHLYLGTPKTNINDYWKKRVIRAGFYRRVARRTIGQVNAASRELARSRLRGLMVELSLSGFTHIEVSRQVGLSLRTVEADLRGIDGHVDRVGFAIVCGKRGARVAQLNRASILDDLREMKLRFGRICWWLWMNGDVGIKRQPRLSRKTGRRALQEEVRRPHSSLVLRLIKTAAMVNDVSEMQVWRWVVPSREKELFRKLGQRVLSQNS